MEPQTPKKLRKNSSRYGYGEAGNDIVSSTPAQKLKHHREPLGNYVCSWSTHLFSLSVLCLIVFFLSSFSFST